jgi:hypothetical protein
VSPRSPRSHCSAGAGCQAIIRASVGGEGDAQAVEGRSSVIASPGDILGGQRGLLTRSAEAVGERFPVHAGRRPAFVLELIEEFVVEIHVGSRLRQAGIVGHPPREDVLSARLREERLGDDPRVGRADQVEALAAFSGRLWPARAVDVDGADRNAPDGDAVVMTIGVSVKSSFDNQVRVILVNTATTRAVTAYEIGSPQNRPTPLK